ncbi:hypothetical protein BHM03_00061100 [Ensete ventricosum]|nr:hypothetical protein BHM03_00061100 [Ensete ventricosum]
MLARALTSIISQTLKFLRSFLHKIGSSVLLQLSCRQSFPYLSVPPVLGGTYRSASLPIYGLLGTTKIDRRRSIKGEKGKKKKRKRRKKKEEEKKKEYLVPSPPTGHPRVATALARGSLASRRHPRLRFFSRARRKIEVKSPR